VEKVNAFDASSADLGQMIFLSNMSITEVENCLFATSQLPQVALRSTCGRALLDELLVEREKINNRIQGILDSPTEP
jgi:regulator of protease activity HflC (stomatin/prohibitin superfamily)